MGCVLCEPLAWAPLELAVVCVVCVGEPSGKASSGMASMWLPFHPEESVYLCLVLD